MVPHGIGERKWSSNLRNPSKRLGRLDLETGELEDGGSFSCASLGITNKEKSKFFKVSTARGFNNPASFSEVGSI